MFWEGEAPARGSYRYQATKHNMQTPGIYLLKQKQILKAKIK